VDVAQALLLALKASIMLTVFSVGLRATWHDALYLLRKPSLLARSLLSMNVVMPLVAAAIVASFDQLAPPMKVALVALAISPVPPILPKKEMRAGGDEAYVVGLLAVIAALAIVTVPLSASLLNEAFGRTGTIAPLAVAKIVLMSVLGPLAAGIAVRHLAPALARKLAQPVGQAGNGLLIATAVPLAFMFWPAMQGLIGNGTVWIAIAMACVGLLVGHLLGGPHEHHRTVLALSTMSRHPAVALSAAVGAGEEAKSALGAILLYLFAAFLVSLPYAAWRRHAAARVPTGGAAP
jgi:BASS family bile acid:Na+ symporter